MRWLVCLQVFFLAVAARGQVKNDDWLRSLLLQENDPPINQVLSQPATYRYQIIYTRIDRDSRNRPQFRNYYLQVDPDQYFNPASTVKLPLALLSLEKINRLRKPLVTKFTTMLTDSTYPGQTTALTDSTAETGKPSIAQYIRKAFLVSDNDAYNRMYEFVGQQTINQRLQEMGYTKARITRRFARATEDQNRHTNGIRFVGADDKLLYYQQPAYNTDSFDFSRQVLMGRAHYDANDSLVNAPIDFTRANNLPLEYLQQQLQAALFPTSVPKRQRFKLNRNDENFLYRYLSQFPSETAYPKYDTGVYYDSYVKFFFRDATHHLPPGVRVFNKVGWAYGCLTDVSYIADFTNRVEFMLAVTIYVNSDGVLNDNKYDYDTIGWPFLYNVGQALYRYELTRTRTRKPDLSRFHFTYTTRPLDDRPSIRDADN